MDALSRLRFDRRGTEVVEAAVTMPIVIFILIGVINMGMVMYAGQMSSEAARHGVRMGSVAQANQIGVATSEAGNFARRVFGVGNPAVAALAPGGVVGSELKIRVTYQVPNFLGGLAGLLLPGSSLAGPFSVSGEATMRQEGWMP